MYNDLIFISFCAGPAGGVLEVGTPTEAFVDNFNTPLVLEGDPGEEGISLVSAQWAPVTPHTTWRKHGQPEVASDGVENT